MAGALTALNKALNQIPKRAESRQAEELRRTFVDSGVASALEVVDHQVLYGRRGTGKTHAFRYLETEFGGDETIAVYIDLRTIGSPDGLFGQAPAPAPERSARLLVDLLGALHTAILEAAIEDDDLVSDATFVRRLDALSEAVTSLRVTGEVEVTQEAEVGSETRSNTELGAGVGNTGWWIRAGTADSAAANERAAARVTRKGSETFRLNFSEVALALRNLGESLAKQRVLLLLDEWSSVPHDLQPYLGEFLVRCVMPLQIFTVKIAAIEQQSNFRAEATSGQMIGIELGADASANLDLDEFMVFEQNEERAREFFRGLFYRHLTLDPAVAKAIGIRSERELIGQGFTDRRAFDELVRAAEGVPRDAINIAAKAALNAGERSISVPDIRASARSWFQTDKEAALRSREEAADLLNYVIDSVIKQKRARGFLVNQKSSQNSLLRSLFDARVLHLVRRGYSAQDQPGERYDVYVIDYGAYVDLAQTKYAPQGNLPAGDDEGAFVDVPPQDLRAIRRAVLDLDQFEYSKGRLPL